MFKLLKNVQIKQLVSVKHKRNYTSCSELTAQYNNHHKPLKYLFVNDNLKSTRTFNTFYLFSNHNRLNIHPQLFGRIKQTPLFISQNCDCHSDNGRKDLDHDLVRIKGKFPQPKTILHNFYGMVALELKEPSFRICPQYKLHPYNKNESSQHWKCTYSIKWPEELKFHKSAATKKEASAKAAWSALIYLLKTGKMTQNGFPLVYDFKTVKKLTKESHYTFMLESFEIDRLKLINNLFENKIEPIINNENIDKQFSSENIYNNNNNEDDVLSSDEVISDWFASQKVSAKNLQIYRAKETVNLPIQKHKEEFERLLDNNRVIIIRGEPGCGKSTRVPQYVLEHFVKNTKQTNARIIITQPRKIAAISLAERVAQERNERVGHIVGYQVRLNSAFNPRTGKILYCTTGILLRQIQADPNLTNCTHIILDEAHERDVNTDLLMNLMRQSLRKNPNLKLIIMSATIDVGLFQEYFNNPTVMNVPGFTHPVKAHFLDDLDLNLMRTAEVWRKYQTHLIYDDICRVVNWIHNNKPEGAILVFLPGWEDIIKTKQLLMHSLPQNSSSIVTIHSKLSHEDQRKIFRHAPPGIRKIILATNIAETSVTVNDVVYVVDTGIQKETRFNSEKGFTCIDNYQISQSSVQQRKGRAGRVQPGESFHLYPRASYNEMLKFSLPEILRVSLTKIVLDAKVYSHNMNSQEFFSHLPCPPKDSTVSLAVEELRDLEMLDRNENLTSLGRVVADFQLPPKLSKAMIYSVIYKCVVPIVDIATIFSFDSEMFADTLTNKERVRQTKLSLSKDSDHIALMILYEQWANLMNNNEFLEASMLCSQHNLIPQKLNTLKQLKNIHYEYLEKYLGNALHLSDEFSTNKEFIKGVLLSGVGSVLFQRNWDFVNKRLKRKKVFLTRDQQKATITSESVNHKKEDYNSPFLVYINEIRSELRRSTIIRETSVIQPLTFVLFKNNELTIDEIFDPSNTQINDPILLKIEGTKFNMLCDRKDATLITNCKNTLKQMENYFVYQLTTGATGNKDVLDNWNKILKLLNEMLSKKPI